ncbi:MAG: hypothetical protein AAGG00_14630 [Cyanobacteria bacterium P01_H01_bin.150]
MNISKVLVTSQSMYINRFQYLFKAISEQLEIQYMPLAEIPIEKYYVKKLSRKCLTALTFSERVEI